MISARHTGAAVLSIGLLASLLSAQQVERLGRPVATFPDPISNVTGLRELSDGRVVIADRLEKAVRFLDLDAGTMEDIGRVGGGPGEYQLPGGLLPLPGDSTLLVDFGNLRVSVIAPDGRITRSTGMMLEASIFFRPTGADRDGRLYFEPGNIRTTRRGTEAPDRVPVVRFDPASGRIDTVAFLPVPELGGVQRVSVSGGAGFTSRLPGLAPYQARDAWAVAPDGRIALVHAVPYHVQWVETSGTTVTGPEIAYAPVPITDADKEAWADRSQSSAVMMVAGGGSGGGSRTIRMPRQDPAEQDWPDHKPPFPRQAASTTPEGDLWVLREVALGAPPTYDVFDGRGRRVRQVALPRGRRLVGFGPGRAYVVRADEDDLQWLEVYARDR